MTKKQQQWQQSPVLYVTSDGNYIRAVMQNVRGIVASTCMTEKLDLVWCTPISETNYGACKMFRGIVASTCVTEKLHSSFGVHSFMKQTTTIITQWTSFANEVDGLFNNAVPC